MSKQTNKSDLNTKSMAELHERGVLGGFKIKKVLNCGGHSCFSRLRMGVFTSGLIFERDKTGFHSRASARAKRSWFYGVFIYTG